MMTPLPPRTRAMMRREGEQRGRGMEGRRVPHPRSKFFPLPPGQMPARGRLGRARGGSAAAPRSRPRGRVRYG